MHKNILTTFLGAGALLLALETPVGAQALTVELVDSGFSSPLLVTSPPNDFDRLFVVEQSGRIKIIKNGATNATPFLNIASLVSCCGEQGLLGMAFHPDYENNRRFYVSYTNTSGNSRVVEYFASIGDPDIADTTPGATVFTQNQPFSNHNGGCIQFGPDGKLYIGIGDGGSGNDPGNRAQNPLNKHGQDDPPRRRHRRALIPADNPFVGDAGTLDEIWALGLRNPWRFSFDRDNGDLYIGDVGQFAVEEINYVPASSTGGENYGWRCMEGNNCTGLSGCTCNAPTLTDPIHDYGHGGGNCSVTGGYVYRGTDIPGLEGTYFFGDYCSSSIWSFRMVGGAVTEFTNRTAELEPPGALTINLIPSFGQDAAGNVYICDFSGGEVFKIVGDCNTDSYCTATVNSSGNPAAITSGGSPSIGTNNFELLGRNVPAGVFGLFFYGPSQIQSSFGDGFRCVGGMTHRLPPNVQADALGNVTKPVDFTAPPVNGGAGMISAGNTWNFQLWFRDPMGPGGTGFNLTDGLSVTFCP